MRGVTHKKEWDKFSRLCQDRKTFPVSLSGYLDRKKVDLFNMWLEQGSLDERLSTKQTCAM